MYNCFSKGRQIELENIIELFCGLFFISIFANIIVSRQVIWLIDSFVFALLTIFKALIFAIPAIFIYF
jgi:hypothetical protein